MQDEKLSELAQILGEFKKWLENFSDSLDRRTVGKDESQIENSVDPGEVGAD
jgi:hypothetical protein